MRFRAASKEGHRRAEAGSGRAHARTDKPARVLAPGGSLACYAGVHALPAPFPLMLLTVRPEVGYCRSYDASAFDNGRRSDLWLASVDVFLRF